MSKYLELTLWVVIQATWSSSCLQGKGSTFVSQFLSVGLVRGIEPTTTYSAVIEGANK